MEKLQCTAENTKTETVGELSEIKDDVVLLLELKRPWTRAERRKYRSYQKRQKEKGVVEIKEKVKKKKYKSPRNKKGGYVPLGDGINSNTEHLNPKSKGGSNHRKNLKESNIRYHQHKHGYFGNKLLHDQLKQVVGDNYDVMYEETRDVIVKAIDHIITYFVKQKKFYNPKTFRNEKFIPNS